MNKSLFDRSCLTPVTIIQTRFRERVILQTTIIVLALILITLFIAGCGSSKKASSQTDSIQLVPIIDKPETLTDSLPIEDILADTIRLIDTFDIALILPFHLDSVLTIPDSVEMNYYNESELAIEFYNGAMIAVEELARNKFPSRIHVYDDANNKERISSIAQLSEFKNMELLIGPVYNNNLRIMAEYAKHDSIYMVSPLSPAANITSYNPYYIMVNPSIEAHCRKIFDYVVAHHHDDNILLFSRPGTNEEKYAAIFQNDLKQYQTETNDYSFQITQVTFNPAYGKDEDDMSNEDLAVFFDDSVTNIVIVPSVEKSYIHSVGRRLYPMVDPPKDIKDPVKYDITVMGFPVWGEQEGLRLDYVGKLNVHFTSSYYVDPSFYNKKGTFYRNYIREFHKEPSEYVIKGYDLMLFFGNMLNKYNVAFDTMLCADSAKGIHTDFTFGIHYAPLSPFASLDSMLSIPRPDYIENKYVHLLKYEDYSIANVE